MPDYLAPGVYVEETSFRAKSIEGVPTSIAAFVGPTRKGPICVDGEPCKPPELLTSLAEFERVYGGAADLAWGDGVRSTNHLWYAARAFFSEGGSRLHVSRVVGAGAACAAVELLVGPDGMRIADDARVAWVARSPGEMGNAQLRVREQLTTASAESLTQALSGSLLRATLNGASTLLLRAEDGQWQLADDAAGAAPDASELLNAEPHIVTLSVQVTDADGEGDELYDGLGLHPSHARWVGQVLAIELARSHGHPLCAIHVGAGVSAAALHAALFQGGAVNAAGELERAWNLRGGRDGAQPVPADYTAALAALESLPRISLLAAPGSTAHGVGEERDAFAAAVASALIAYAETPGRYCLAVLDTPPGLSLTEVREYRGRFDSSCAAIYFPWVVGTNPHARADIAPTILLPPSGFICGICARVDVQQGVHKAPANEVVNGALRFEIDISKSQQDVLNPLGVNCLRYFNGRGFLVWGARLISSDPEWKYLNLRRYFNYLEASLGRGLAWVALEQQGDRLWAMVLRTIHDFLYDEWRRGALLGASAKQAFFVRCDRSTMTQADLDAGRLVCLIGVAPVRPGEFVIMRNVQRTASAPT